MKCDNCGKEMHFGDSQHQDQTFVPFTDYCSEICREKGHKKIAVAVAAKTLLADEEFWVRVRSELAEHYDDKKKPIEIVKEAFRNAAGIKE